MGNDRHLRIFVWRWALQIASSWPKERQHFWLGKTGLSFPEMCTRTMKAGVANRHPSKHELNVADTNGHYVPHTTDLLPKKNLFLESPSWEVGSPVSVLPRPHVTSSPAVNTTEAGAAPLKIFTLGWFSPPRQKNFVFPHLFERLAREVQVPLTLFQFQQDARLFLSGNIAPQRVSVGSEGVKAQHLPVGILNHTKA